MKDTIAIIECFSNGRYYIDDIISLGYAPLLVYRTMTEDERERETLYCGMRDRIISEYSGRAEIVFLPENADDILASFGRYRIAAVIPGSEFGLSMTDIISERLGLRGNPPKTTNSRTSKNGMHNALRKAGMRYLESRIIRSDEDIDAFWKGNDVGSAVLKYSTSTASQVCKCNSAEEAKRTYAGLRETDNFNMRYHAILLQEYVHGKEYIVNTVSHEGRHRVTQVLRSYKKTVDNVGILQCCTILLTSDFPGKKELEEYTLDMLDAVGLENGPAHSELCVDEKGPILIEINARIMGGSFPKEVLDEATGEHMTDTALGAYLGTETFFEYMGKESVPEMSVLVKDIVVPKDTVGDPTPFLGIVGRIPEFKASDYHGGRGVGRFPRTVDLLTSPFSFTFSGPDEGRMRDLCRLMRRTESEYIDLVIIPPEYLTDDRDASEVYGDLVTIADSLEDGEKIHLPPETCDAVPYGAEGLRILLEYLEITAETDGAGGLNGIRNGNV